MSIDILAILSNRKSLIVTISRILVLGMLLCCTYTNLLTVFRYMTDTVAAIAKILILLAFTCKVSKLIAFEALLSTTSKAAVSVASAITPASTTTLWTLPCKVAHTITFITGARTHFYFWAEVVYTNLQLYITHVTID